MGDDETARACFSLGRVALTDDAFIRVAHARTVFTPPAWRHPSVRPSGARAHTHIETYA